jgi:hypothetical protein
MKKKLLLLAIAFTFVQQIQAQTTQDLFEIGTSLFGSSKKQKKKDRENFVIDSTNNAVATNKKKREIFVKDSLLNIEFVNRQKKEIKEKELEEKRKYEWDYVGITPHSFTFNKTIVGYFVGENTDSPRIAMDIFSDSTATTKIGSIKLSQILPTEVFDVLAYNYYHKRYLIKSAKGNKICLIDENVMYYQNWGKGNGTTLTTEYTAPKVLAQEKLILDNYRLKVKNALLTVTKLEAINNKHLVNMVNAFGVVVEQKYDTNKFTKVEKVTYKQLIQKLEVQLDEINSELAKKVGYNKTLRGLLEIPDINKQMEIEHAYTDYSYYTLNW